MVGKTRLFVQERWEEKQPLPLFSGSLREAGRNWNGQGVPVSLGIRARRTESLREMERERWFSVLSADHSLSNDLMEYSHCHSRGGLTPYCLLTTSVKVFARVCRWWIHLPSFLSLCSSPQPCSLMRCTRWWRPSRSWTAARTLAPLSSPASPPRSGSMAPASWITWGW